MGSTPEPAVKFPFEVAELEVPKEFAALRAEQPVLRVEMPFGGEGWLLNRYEDVRFMLGDPRFSRALTIDAEVPRTSPPKTQPGHLMAMDPPEHTRLRKLVASSFTEKNVRRWRSRVDEILVDLIADIRGQGAPIDLVEHFSKPLPVTVVCELLGVPVSDRHFFQHFAEIVFSTTGVSPEEIAEGGAALHTYLLEFVARRREQPQDDLISQLIAVRSDDEDRLSEHELVSMAGSILVAGHESTANEISNFVYTLLATGQWSQLLEHPDWLETAVDELLRYVALGYGDAPPRVATEDVEIGGQLIRKGESVIANIVSANRDESVFTDGDTLNLRRDHNPHIALGHGAHRCLGAQLARMELEAGLGALLRELPGLRLATDPGEVPWRGGIRTRGPEKLLVAW